MGTWMGTQILIYRERIWKERIHLNYLGATLVENGHLDAEMTHRMQSGWKHWTMVSEILCDRRISLRVKGE